MNTITHAEFKLLPGSDLEILYVEYRDPEDGHVEADIYNKELLNQSEFNGVDNRCACCGAHIKYSAGVHIHSLGYHVRVGLTCGFRIENLPLNSNLNLTYLRERAIAKRAEAKFIEETNCGELIEWARSKDAHHIARGIAGKLAQYGSISEKQLELIASLKAKAEAKAAADAEFAPKAPAPEGRVEVTGTVLGFKEVESDYGITTKMIVRLLDTFAKVYVTVPSGLDADRGSKVRFTATFERARDDQFFAFGKRPTKATLVA
jgi:hypothetical protein